MSLMDQLDVPDEGKSYWTQDDCLLPFLRSEDGFTGAIMPTATATDRIPTLEDVLHQLGDIPLHRILMQPPPGTATEEDLIAACEAPQKRLCELIDDVLVEKVMGMQEAILAGIIIQFVNNYLYQNDIGIAAGADGPFRVFPSQVRLPDVSIFTWQTIGSRTIPQERIWTVVPDIAVEVVSEGNTAKEIHRKLQEYFLAGVSLVWIIYPNTQSARIYTGPDKYKRVSSSQSLTANDILPGFELPMATLFEHVAKPKKPTK